MLTNNKAVYGTDGTLKTLKDMGGAGSPGSSNIYTDDGTKLNILYGTKDEPTFTNLEYRKDYYLKVWIIPDEGDLIYGIVKIRKNGKDVNLSIDDNGLEHSGDEFINYYVKNATDEKFDLQISGGRSWTIFYYEFIDFEEVD